MKAVILRARTRRILVREGKRCFAAPSMTRAFGRRRATLAVATRSPFHALVKETWCIGACIPIRPYSRTKMRRIYGRTGSHWPRKVRSPIRDFKPTRSPAADHHVRHSDGDIHVLFNRCLHRGAVVCEFASGNTSHFRCPYHAGRTRPMGSGPGANRELFGSDFDLSDYGLISIPRGR